jgi:hypothetical protein
VAAGDGHHEVVDGDGEGPFAGCPAHAAGGEAADAHVVLDAAVGGLGDAAALPVGGDAVGGLEAGGHRGGRGAVGSLPAARAAGFLAGGFLHVAALAGGDEPVRAAAGEVGLAEVAGVGEGQADLPGSRAAGGGHQGGGLGGVLHHGLHQRVSVVLSVRRVAVMRPSSLVTFWAL